MNDERQEEVGTDNQQELSNEAEETKEEILSEEDILRKKQEFESQMKDAPIIEQDVGKVVVEKSADALKKAAYYVVFAPKDHEADKINQAIKSVHIARFETRTQLKSVIKSLDDSGFKMIDIIRGRPLSFEIKIKTVSEINIGQ